MAKNINKIRIKIKNCRLSFANIFEPKSFNGGQPRYSANLLISKEDAQTILEVRDAIKKVIALEWTKDTPKFKDNQLCLRDGDQESWGGYEGNFFISSGNRLKPKVVDLDGTDLTEHSEDNSPGDKPQPGDYVNAVIEVWAQNNDFGKRINANLVGIQYVKQGERFGKASDDDLFEITEKVEQKVEVSAQKVAKKPGVSDLISSSLSDQSLKSIQDDIDDIFGE